MYDETGPDGKRRYTVAQIAAEFGVTRRTVYCHLANQVEASELDAAAATSPRVTRSLRWNPINRPRFTHRAGLGTSSHP
jgi:hypothetical protein